MSRIAFRLPLYPGRHEFTDQALDDLERLMNAGDVPLTRGAGGPVTGRVLSAERDGDSVRCVAEVDDAWLPLVAGVGLDVRIPTREDKRIVPSIAEAPAAILRRADELEPGARPLES